MKWLIITLFMACSHNQDKDQWQGHPIEQVQKHSYFSKLEVKVREKGGKEIHTYSRPGKFRTGAQCQALGGCMGMPQTGCEYVFEVENRIITSSHTHGQCPTTGKPGP